MDEPKTLNHSKWECDYHVVFMPKYRTKPLYVELRPLLGGVIRDLARRWECESTLKAHPHRNGWICSQWSVQRQFAVSIRY